MEVRELRADEVGRLVDECWFPYAEELAEHDPGIEPDPAYRDEQAEFLRERVEDGDGRLLVAVDGDRFVGFASGSIGRAAVFSRSAWLAVGDVYVAPSHRRRGVATALLDDLEAWGANRGAEQARLDVDAANDAARACYEARGYDVWRHQLSREL